MWRGNTSLRRLAIFVGGCTLEAAEAVCSRAADLSLPAMDLVASLLDKSLVGGRVGTLPLSRLTVSVQGDGGEPSEGLRSSILPLPGGFLEKPHKKLSRY